MGNSESQQGENSTKSSKDIAEMRRDYYEILEVERSELTTTDDIKKVWFDPP